MFNKYYLIKLVLMDNKIKKSGDSFKILKLI